MNGMCVTEVIILYLLWDMLREFGHAGGGLLVRKKTPWVRGLRGLAFAGEHDVDYDAGSRFSCVQKGKQIAEIFR